ncbi:MAG: protein-L-isoaspartate O-methyltransferase [Enterovirga sp.]|nr:protein-L-isoaspartate O-methyltransferase [Enterovirga sp.]
MLSLRARGIFDLNVLRAMETVPRELFAPRRFADLSRSDVALPLACGQTMTAPRVVAAMLAALAIEPGHRVLEVGTGSGYVTALLARIGADVYSVERHASLADSARARIGSLGMARSVFVECGDGLGGGRFDVRFDRILLNGALPQLDTALTSRLAGGGRLVAATPIDGAPHLLTLVRDTAGELHHALGLPLRISPLVDAKVKRDGCGGNGSLTATSALSDPQVASCCGWIRCVAVS